MHNHQIQHQNKPKNQAPLTYNLKFLGLNSYFLSQILGFLIKVKLLKNQV